MVDQIIRPSALPRRTNPVASEIAPVDNGTSVAGSTLAEIVNAGRPVASRAEAEVGANAEKAMTPLTVDQKIEYEIGRSLASKAQGDRADSAVQPSDLATVATTGSYNDLNDKPTLTDETSAESRAWAISNLHPISAPSFIRTAGYAVPGDLGGALYRLVLSEPSHPGKFSITLDDGVSVAWYEIAETRLLPEMFGAKGDGSTNDAAAFGDWAAMMAAIPAPRFGVLLAKTYKLDTANIPIPSDTTIEGQGCVIDISAAPAQTWAFLIRGTEGARYPLTANASGTTAAANASDLVAGGILAGSWVRLTSNAVFDSQRTNSRIGEMAMVRTSSGVTGALTFGTPGSVSRPLADAYLVVDDATISKLDVLKNTHFIGRGLIKSNNNFGVSGHKGVAFDMTVNCSLEGWGGYQLDDRFLSVQDSTGFFGNSIFGDDFKSSGTGYLVSVAGCSQDCYFEGLTSRLIRHTFTTNNPSAFPGIPRRIFVNGFLAIDSSTASGGSGGDAMDTHAASEDIHFANGIIRNSSGVGLIMEGRGGSLSNIKIYGSASHGIYLGNWSDRAADYQLSDIEVYDCAGEGVRINTAVGAGPIASIEARNIKAVRSGTTGFYIFGSVTQTIAVANLNGVSALGYAGSSGIYLSDIKLGTVSGLLSSASALTPASAAGVRIRNCENVGMTGLNVALPSASTGNAVLLDQSGASPCRRLSVDDIFVTGSAPASSVGLRISNLVSDVTVGPRRRFNAVTTGIVWGTGTGHLKVDAVAAP